MGSLTRQPCPGCSPSRWIWRGSSRQSSSCAATAMSTASSSRKPPPMCDDRGHGAAIASVAPHRLGEAWAGEVVPLEPVDGVSILTVCDNSVDFLLPDEGPARRIGLDPAQYLAAPSLLEGKTADGPVAQHG